MSADDNRPQVVHLANIAFTAHQQHFVAFTQPPGAIVAVIGFHTCLQRLRSDAGRGHAHWIRNYFVGSRDTSEHVDISDAPHRAQRWADHPIEQVFPLHERKRGVVDSKLEHFTQRRRDWRHAAFDPTR